MILFVLCIVLAVALLVALAWGLDQRARVKTLTGALSDTHTKLVSDMAALQEAVLSIAAGGDLKTILSRLNTVATLVKAVVDDMRAATTTTTDAPPAPPLPSESAPAAPPDGQPLPATVTVAAASPAPNADPVTKDPLAAVDAELATLKAKRDRIAKAMEARRAAQDAERAAEAELAELTKS